MSNRDSEEPSRRRNPLFHRRNTPAQPTAAPSSRRTRYVVDGLLRPTPEDVTVAEALVFADAAPNRIALTLFPAPTAGDIDEIADAWDLHPLLVEDLQHAGQRPKLERYGDVLFMVVRSARYDDAAEDVDFSEFHVLVRPHAIAVLCQDGRWIDGTDEAAIASDPSDIADRGGRTLLDDGHLLSLGPEAVAYRLLDAIVDGYTRVLRGLAIDKEQIERQVFSGDSSVAERIYRLSQEVIDLQHTTSSMTDVLAELRRGFDRYEVPEPLQAYLQDVADHLAHATTRVTELREALSQILSVNATLVAQRQNEDMKKISGWAAILFAPTLIGAIYGMNFDHMPELHWAFGYPLALGSMALFGLILYVIFRVKKWM
ncbi:magnesium and cobalt transport protein CorA [Mycetocola tolaasinivorans]|uniref:Magnesium and cobalt transport protein CorA n=1 Tax=Mycetocola tolaasinivorans TaxID=76635 RepID=A0A3L7A912_9MICO|nr:magnesium and cobalt transport protein CorA [Mycetocola tolaasinivorans]RLP76896.1 magnesium and cobalt transport protein CorA [Mycetocola tolaasinivorans]